MCFVCNGKDEMNKLLGFSTASLYRIYPRASKENIQLCRELGSNILALHCHIKNFDMMDKLERKDFKDFKFLTFHLPGGIKKDHIENNKESIDFLKRVKGFHDKLKFDAIVVHPDTIEDWDLLKSFDMPFSVENMDERKTIGKTLESMKEIMSDNDFKVTLDVNHCYVNDPSMELDDEFWNEFKNRISHFHLSGYKTRHDPLVVTKQKELIEFVKDKNRPIIIESNCESIEQAREEIEYIKKYL